MLYLCLSALSKVADHRFSIPAKPNHSGTNAGGVFWSKSTRFSCGCLADKGEFCDVNSLDLGVDSDRSTGPL